MKNSFVSNYSYIFSCYLTIILTLERYVAICKPHWVRSQTHMIKKTKIAIWCVTVFSILYNVPRFFENKWKNGTLEKVLLADKTYKMVYKTWMYFVFAFSLPCVILIIFNILVIKKVQSQMKIKAPFIRSNN